jgi:hypothetical protein
MLEFSLINPNGGWQHNCWGGASASRLLKIKEEVLLARRENKLYPEYGGFTVNLEKSDFPVSTNGLASSVETKFVRCDEEREIQPAIIEDGVDLQGQVVVTSKTWEQYIADNKPIFPNVTGSLLPRIVANRTNRIKSLVKGNS